MFISLYPTNLVCFNLTKKADRSQAFCYFYIYFDISKEAEIMRVKKTIDATTAANLNISSAFGSSTSLNIYLKIVSNLLNKFSSARYFDYNFKD